MQKISPGELSKRVHRIFPDADDRVKPMMTLPAINTDASKHEKEQISRAVGIAAVMVIIAKYSADFHYASAQLVPSQPSSLPDVD